MDGWTSSKAAWTRWLVIATVVVLGLIGGMADRVVVATPAWRELGALGWAGYSLKADHGYGLILYPIQGILPTVLSVAAAVTHRLDRGARRSAGPPIYLTAVAMIGVLGTTLLAAPIMLGVGDLGTDAHGLQEAFETFTLWGVYVRGGLFAVAFVAAVWAAIASLRSPRPAPVHG